MSAHAAPASEPLAAARNAVTLGSSLAVTTSVDQVVAAADATEAIVKGFKVSVPSAVPAPAAPLGAPPAPAPPV